MWSSFCIQHAVYDFTDNFFWANFPFSTWILICFPKKFNVLSCVCVCLVGIYRFSTYVCILFSENSLFWLIDFGLLERVEKMVESKQKINTNPNSTIWIKFTINLLQLVPLLWQYSLIWNKQKNIYWIHFSVESFNVFVYFKRIARMENGISGRSLVKYKVLETYLYWNERVLACAYRSCKNNMAAWWWNKLYSW